MSAMGRCLEKLLLIDGAVADPIPLLIGGLVLMGPKQEAPSVLFYEFLLQDVSHKITKVTPAHFDVARQHASGASGLYAFADLVQQKERGFVINAKIAGDGQQSRANTIWNIQ